MFPDLSEQVLRELAKKSSGEADVYRAFRDGTPADWLVLHGLQLIAVTPAAPPKDGEADFVVFDPHRGFLVVEVKGGSVTRDARGQWWSGRLKIKDPIVQAVGNKHQVLRNLKRASGWGPAGAPSLLMGHAALCPKVGDMSPFVGPDRPAEILGGRTAVQDLTTWINGVFTFWAANDTSWQPLGATGMAVVHSIYCASISVQPLLALIIALEQKDQIELTQRQARVLQNLRYRSRAAIAGGAGTGKTLLALQHAQALASQGRRTLLVCYNRALGDFLRREVAGSSVQNLEVSTFHQLCDSRIKAIKDAKGIDLLERAAREYPAGNLYGVQKPYALALSTEADPFRFEAILVDEGQDFDAECWFALELLLDRQVDAQFYVFFDPNQAIYSQATSIPSLGPPVLLTENCRSTRPVHEIAYKYYRGDEIACPEIPGEPIGSLNAVGLNAQAEHIRSLVSDLLHPSKGLKPEDIAVLVTGDGKDEHFRALHDGGTPSGANWSFEQLWQPGSVLVDTARRFKGLEATAVILWCSNIIEVGVERELLYVALSRARNRLWIVGSPEQIARVLAGV